MPIVEWPPLDRQAWDAGWRPGTPFEPSGPAASWADATREVVQNGLRPVTDLVKMARPARSLRITSRPDQRGTPCRLCGRSEVAGRRLTIFTRVQQVCDALRAMVRGKDWRWIIRAAHRIRSRAAPVRDKRAPLQSPDRLIDLGMQMMADANQGSTALRFSRL